MVDKVQKELGDNRLWVLKALAIFCVVCAHTAESVNGKAGTEYWINYILNMLGTMGVPVFYIISGMLYKPEKHTFKLFWKKKLKSIVLPWVFCDTIVWLYVVLRKGGMTIGAWIIFVLGINHSTYYLTVLCIFYLLFWYIAKKKNLVWGIVILSAVYYILYCLKIIPEICITPYMNPMNWMVYFALGVALRGMDKERIFQIAKKNLIWAFPLFIASMLMCGMEGINYSYWSIWAPIITILSTLCLVGLSALKICSQNSILIKLGKMSFSIYLLNHFFAGVSIWITNKLSIDFFAIIRPFFVISIIALGIFIAESINKVCKNKFKFILNLIGYAR